MSDFKVGDKVVPRLSHPWNEICCVIQKIDDEGCLVSNGKGESQYFQKHQLDHLCYAVFEYVTTQIHVNPELKKKVIYIEKEG